MSAEPSSAWSSVETRLLDRLLYKYNNQHRKTPYFHKLQQVRRAARAVEAEVRRCVRGAQQDGLADPDGDAEPDADEDVIAALLYPRSDAHMERISALLHSLLSAQCVILHCSRPLYGLLSQTYFMSFALAALALLARLYATQRAMLLPLLDKCVQAQTAGGPSGLASASAASVHSPRAPSFAQLLHRAMRTETGEREWLERCAALEDVFAPCTDAELAAPLMSAKLGDGAANQLPAQQQQQHHQQHHSDGDSDEEEGEGGAESVAPAVLPAQLKFFASPVAVAKPGAQAPRAAAPLPSRPAPSPSKSVGGVGPLASGSSPSPAAAAGGAITTPHRSLKRPAAAAALAPLAEEGDDDETPDTRREHSDDDELEDAQMAPAAKPTAAAAAKTTSALMRKKKQRKLSHSAAAPLAVTVAAPTALQPSAAAVGAAATASARARSDLAANVSTVAPIPQAGPGAADSSPATAAPIAPAALSLLAYKKKKKMKKAPMDAELIAAHAASPSVAAPAAPLALPTRTTPMDAGVAAGRISGASPVTSAPPPRSAPAVAPLASGSQPPVKKKKKALKSARARSDEMDDIFG